MLSRYSNEFVRKGTWTCLSCSSGTRVSQALLAGSTNRSSAQTHQRKHSSSKTPNSPKHEPRAIATPSEAPTKDAKPVAKQGSSTKVNKRKSKDGFQDTAAKGIPNMSFMNLPNVPSTGHLHDAGTCIAPSADKRLAYRGLQTSESPPSSLCTDPCLSQRLYPPSPPPPLSRPYSNPSRHRKPSPQTSYTPYRQLSTGLRAQLLVLISRMEST